jgi:hypothetical protein
LINNLITKAEKPTCMKSSLSLASTILSAFLLINPSAIAQTAATSSAAPDAVKTETVTTPAVKKWTCVAEGLAEFSYDGSGWARIRLSAYSTGGNYRITKDEKGDTAKGVTQDRTPFVCTNK